jgi:LysM repeat protein
VIAGDSIGSIAEQYGADMFEVMAANNLDENSAALLQIGQTLIIPVEGCVVENSPLISTETPSSGQNSSGIAFDSAITLDGVNDYVESPSQSILDVSAFTVELWVYPTAIQDGYQPLVVRDLTEEFQRSFGLYIEPNSLYTHFSFSSDCTWYYYYTSNTPLPIETWTHVSMTYDGTNFTLYYNGEVDRQVQVSGQVCQPDAPLSIGHTYGDFPKANFGGRLAEVRIWDYARTQSEISASMNVTLTGTEAGLVALYPLTDTDDGSAEELVIGNNGVVHR